MKSGSCFLHEASARLAVLTASLLFAGLASAQFTPAPGSPFNVGSGAGASALGDFNGDGKQDIAVLVTGGVAVLLGNGSGGFTAAPGITLPVGSFGVSIAVADLNGDGKQDLVIVNGDSPNLTVLLGNGLGGFSADPGSPFALPVPSPGTGRGVGTKVVVADFNGDGKQDLAIATPTIGANRGVVVLLGDGAGGLTLAPGIYAARDTDFVAVGDFNGDGIPDLVLGTGTSGFGAPTVLLGNGSGGFTVAPAGTLVSDFVSAAVGDFNLDGKLDLAVASVEGNNVSVLLGNGSGGFTAAPGGPIAGASSPVVADFNGDGFPDLAVVTSSGVEVLLGNGLGGFVAAPGGAITSESGFLLVGDFNGDGRPDLAVSNTDGLTVLLNSLPVITANPASLTFYGGTGQPATVAALVTVNSTVTGSTYTVVSNEPWLSSNPTSNVTGSAGTVSISANPSSLSAGTYSGIVRYAAPNFFDASTIVTLNVANPSGTFVTAAGGPFAVGTNPGNAVVADFNRDGKPDLAVVNQGSNNVTVLLGNGSGGFSAASGSPFAAGTSPISIAAGDFNGDGKPDLAVLNQGSNNVTILLGNGSGGFKVGPSFGVVPLPSPSKSSISVGDFNGDGIQDLVVTASLSGGAQGVVVLLGNGFGGFSPGTPFAAGSPTSLAVGDFNGDGKLDVVFTNVMTNITDPQVTMLLGDGAGGFTAAQLLKVTATAGGQPVFVGSSIAVGYFSGNGVPDIAVGLPDGVGLLVGDGSGGFTGGVVGPSGTPSSLAFGDFDGDGVLDLAIATNSGLTVLLGNSDTPLNGPFATDAGAFIAPADFNGDGRPDLAVVEANGVTVLLGAPVSTQSTLTTTSPLTIPYGISVPLTLTVSGTTPPFDLIYGQAAFSDGATLLGTSPSPSAISYQFTASNLGIGSHILSATFTSSDTRSLGSSSNTITIQVVPASQIITFRPLSSVTLGVAPFTISATASSGLPVSLASSTPAVCTLAGNTVTIVAAGSCSITATQSGNSNYLAALSVTQSFTVSLASAASQTITFPPLSNVTFGIAPFTINATASSGLPVTLTSTTLAVCTIAAKTVTVIGAGTCSITASQGGNANYNPALAVAQNFKVNQIPSGTLAAAPGSPFPIGTPALATAVGDFNGDGKQDLAVVSSASDGVTILLGNGAGGFSAAPGSPFAVGSSISSIAAADFNGDGKMDLAVAGINGVTLLLGDGLGGFSAGGPAGNPFNATVAAGDFNGDGIPDLVEAVAIDAYGRFGVVTVLLGNGSGGFTPGTSFRAFLVYVGTVTAVGDFNGDGKLDVVLTGFANSGPVVLLGDGAGGFTGTMTAPSTVSSILSGAVGDFNGDGISDLAVAYYDGLAVLLGDSSGVFKLGSGSPISLVPFTGPGAQSVAVGDFNGDGIRDIAVQYGLGPSLTVLLGDGSGGFTQIPGGPIATGIGGFFASADFNRDGRPDLAIVSPTNVSVLLGALAPTSSALTTTSPLTITYGTNVPLSLAVSDTVPAFNAPSGTATFSDGATALGSASQTGSPYSFTASGLSAGSHTLTASYGGDPRSLGSSSNSITIQVTTGSQTITFGALNNVLFGVPPFSITATASSGLPVTFASTTQAVCTVAGSTVSVLATGICSITASQAGNAYYSAAPPVTQSFTVSSAAGPPVTDNFNTSTLNTSLWTFLNPVGNGSFSMTGTQLKLTVPAGSNHDPVFGGADNSVRVVQSIANADFTVTTKFDSIPNQLYQFEGIVVNQDAANYLRFQFGSTGSALYATASVILSRNETSAFSNPITLPGGTTSLWLRVRKAGNTWTESWSPNGTTFTTAGTFTSTLTAAAVGPFAGNYNPTTSSAPAFSAVVDSFISLSAAAPDLTITKSHTGNFTQGQTGATYTITVTNSGGAQTSGVVTVTDAIPTGLTATTIAGAGWTCTQPAGPCTRSDALATAASYPALALTVNVAGNAPATVTNTATVSGGGETNTSNDTASDATTVSSPAGPPVTDNFNSSTLNTSLWTFLNPVGDGSFSMTGTQLKLTVPAGSNHDPVFGGADNSVRVVQPIANSDFTVTIKFDSIPNQLYQFEGIVVNQDTANYLRFQFGSTGSALYATASVILAHNETSEFSNPITLPGGTTSLWLRVQKTGNTWTESWSPNGTTFNTAGTFTSTLTASAIGPFAGNYNPTTSSAPGLSALVDSFVSVTAAAPDLTIAKSHTGNFTQGQTGATYTIAVTNSGGAQTGGTVTVTDTIPTGLTATSIAGAGWACAQPAGSCTRSDALAPAASYPALTLTVNVASNAPATVTNTATVAGGGETNTSNDTASDATAIGSPAGPPVTDNFNTSTLNTSLWTFLNPVGNGSLSMTGTQLQLNVPAGSNHDPVFGGADNSVRAVQSIANSDFTVTVKFDSIPNQLYEFEGIVVNQDAANYLRFQFGSTANTLYATASAILSHNETSEFSNPITLPGGTTSLWLRVQKAGNTWTESWSPNGTTFNTAGTFSSALTAADIGPFAGNYHPTTSSAPGFSALVDSFVSGASGTN